MLPYISTPKGGGDIIKYQGKMVASSYNKQPTNSFNKQIPIWISHEAEGPPMECSEASCLALDVAASAGSLGPAVLQTCRVSTKRIFFSSRLCLRRHGKLSCPEILWSMGERSTLLYLVIISERLVEACQQ